MNKLRAARIAAKLTQQQLADKIGVVRQNVDRWEHGIYTPKVDKLVLLAAALDCKIEDLI